MSLSDPKYLVFLAATVLVFYLLRGHWPRAAMLLGASYGFYFNLSGYYEFVLFFVTAVAYTGGLLLSWSAQAHQRGMVFAACSVVLLAPLIVFKYLGFIFGIVSTAVGSTTPVLMLALPIGISFFTFAALGYLIDVYLEVIEPERRPIEFALYVAFFPLVTAGPIERGGHFLPQFDFGLQRFSSDRAIAACRLIILGLFLKLFCADTLVTPVNAIFADPAHFVALEKLFGLIYFMFYIYSDFAGYSLIAIGSGLLFGLEVLPNFRQPFLSTTVPEFWRNWHMSLSNWVRDYLFTPLHMHWRRNGNLGLVAALMISFLVLGIWHGAGWGFVLFGLMHGLLVTGSTLTLKYRDALASWVGTPQLIVRASRIVSTFLLVMLTFVVYRANSMHDAMLIYSDIFSNNVFRNHFYDHDAFNVIDIKSPTWLVVGAVIASYVLPSRGVFLEKQPIVVQMFAYNVGAALVLYGWVAHTAAPPFLYYRF